MNTIKLPKCFCALLLATAFPTIVFSQPIAVVGSVTGNDTCDKSTVTTLIPNFRAALSGIDANVKSDKDLIAALGDTPAMSLTEIDQALVSRREDILQMKYGEAIKPLLEVITEIMLHPPSRRRCNYIRDAYSKLAWSYKKMLVRKRGYEATVERLVRVGDFELDYYLFPPSFHQEVAQARRDIEKIFNSSLTISTNPLGLTIHIDGCPVGKAPLKIKVPRGEYQIDIEFPAGRGLSKTIKVQGDMNINFDQEFEGAIFVDKGPCVAFPEDSKKRLTSFARLRSLLGVKSVMALRRAKHSNGKNYLVVESIEKNENYKEAKIEEKLDQATDNDIQKLAKSIVSGKAIHPVELINKEAIASNSNTIQNNGSNYTVSEKSWFRDYQLKRIAAWTLAGIAAIAAGATVIEQLRMEKANRNANNLDNSDINFKSDHSKYESDYNSASKLRTGFAIGTALAGAGAATLFYLNTKPAVISDGRTSKSGFLFTYSRNF